ncbi:MULTISPECIES: archaellin/type IV pilin N-terminal domain-containing protein [Halobellus]|uniref:archaellin/type IV pilin N-terminal domain-containing protein n=1 Tax=Halobellus TaxID=1073986 RepID=UPI002114A074|nr:MULTISPECIES: archaellin/type IV pilin N-terminal domain-containing protein [Halobellus]MDQ2053437.1 flagellin [Halobellus sp. H-GB7]
MFEQDDADRGQVGIGTLIVFIAMVLVAAIAAGVLVNTAGFLQATAEDAGQESVDKVTNRLDVVSTHGMVNDSDPKTIDNLNLTVRMAAGSGSVNLNTTTIKYLSGTTAETLTLNHTASSAGGASFDNTTDDEFIATSLDGTDNSFPVLDEQSDRYEIRINTSIVEGTTANGTQTGDTVKLDITTQSGGTSQVILTMPQQLAGNEDGDPVPL